MAALAGGCSELTGPSPTGVSSRLLATSAFEWEIATPESQGMDGAKLDALRQTLETKGTRTFLVIRNDKIVYEWYDPSWGNASTRHFTASVAKAVVGGLSLALALNDGRIELADPVWHYVPAWQDDAQRSLITIGFTPPTPTPPGPRQRSP